METLTTEMTHAQWIETRRSGIGGSDAAAILGMNPYMTPHDVWLSKTRTDYTVTENKAMKIGKLMEPVLAQLYYDETGIQLSRYPAMIFDEKYPMLLGNIDYYVDRDGDFVKGVELKTTSSREKNKWDGEISLYHYCQVQHYMYLFQQSEWDVMIYLRDVPDWYIVTVHRNEDFIRGMIESLVEFWETFVIPGVEPPLEIDEVYKYKPLPGTEIEATVELFDKIQDRVRLANDVKDLKTRLDNIDNEIKMYMGNHELLMLNGKKLATCKLPAKAYHVPAKLLQTKHPEIYNELKQEKNQTPRLTIHYKD